MSFLLKLRQYNFPREFRISEPKEQRETVENLEKLQEKLIEFISKSSSEKQLEHKEDNLFLADVATGLWRLKQKLTFSGTDQPTDEMRKAYRHLQSIWDSLTQAGIMIQDHTGELFDSGMSIKAMAFQPTKGLFREEVIETIKPSVYINDKRIQMGEVIVGTPE